MPFGHDFLKGVEVHQADFTAGFAHPLVGFFLYFRGWQSPEIGVKLGFERFGLGGVWLWFWGLDFELSAACDDFRRGFEEGLFLDFEIWGFGVLWFSECLEHLTPNFKRCHSRFPFFIQISHNIKLWLVEK